MATTARSHKSRHSVDETNFPLTYPTDEVLRRASIIKRNSIYVEDTSKDIVSREGREFEFSQHCSSADFPNVLVAYVSGRRTEHVQCIVTRDRSNMIYPSYEMRLEDSDQILIIAKKLSMGRMSSYHFFDMTKSKGQPVKALSKKSENYLGKLRNVNSARTEYILVDHSTEQLELAGYVFDRLEVHPKSEDSPDGLVSPRKLSVALPLLKSGGFVDGNRVTEDGSDFSLSNVLRGPPSPSRATDVHTFGTKSPVLVNGNFRLNFRGRVTVPSIKNFQLIPDDELNNVILQFGKIDDDIFNLDFKAPFNALQAFAAALSQFSM